MAKICGEVKVLAPSSGGGVHVTNTEYVYSDGSRETRQNWYKSRMVFPLVQIGDAPVIKRALVSNDQLGHDLGENVAVGDRVCLYFFGHLLRKKCIIGVRKENGETYTIPGKGLYGGLFWYSVFSPIIVAIPAALLGMLVGSIGGKSGTAFGLLLGVLYAVGISWYSGYRFYKAMMEMRSDLRSVVPASGTLAST